MRLRILRQVASPFGRFSVGDTAEIPDKTAEGWIKAGIAMEDKSEDGGRETKSESKRVLQWCGKCGCSHRIDSDIGRSHLGGQDDTQ